MVSRRSFLDAAVRCGSTLAAGRALEPLLNAAPPSLEALRRQAPVARYWAAVGAKGLACTDCHAPGSLKAGRSPRHEPAPVKCLLCAHGCVIRDGERGRCRARLNVQGTLRTLVYGRPIAEHVDPIEKKPFYHFLPGSEAYSLATSGCPLRCRFCQNWEISQAAPEDYRAEWCGAEAMAARVRSRSALVVAFTYNEPTVFLEYMVDIARAARQAGLRSVLVSCGFMNEAPLQELIGVLDAIKIDLKGFSRDFYRQVSGAELEPVLRSIRQVARSGRHLEIVNLVVPTLNDSERDLRELAAWVAGEAGPDVPLHFTRFHPDYQLLNLPPTPVATLEKAYDLARRAGLRHVYVGNVPGHPGNHTQCPRCGKVCIERKGFFITSLRLKAGCCASCGHKLAGVWT